MAGTVRCRSEEIEAHVSDTSWVPEESLQAAAGGLTAVLSPRGIFMCTRCSDVMDRFVWMLNRGKQRKDAMIFPPYNCLNWNAPLGTKADLDVLQLRWNCVVSCGKPEVFPVILQEGQN